MMIDLLRDSSGEEGTLGRLSVDGVFVCYSLEPDEDRPQHPAIPCGTYQVIVNYSQRFGRRLPLIVDVPDRSGIRVHPGNTDDDTEGCILLGTNRRGFVLEQSRAACELFQSKIALPLASGERVTITVRDAAAPIATEQIA